MLPLTRKRINTRIGHSDCCQTVGKGGLIFASEIKAILATGMVKPTVDEQGLMEIEEAFFHVGRKLNIFLESK
mgnify:CR=1 FL=1